jgi:hypothetical protein
MATWSEEQWGAYTTQHGAMLGRLAWDSYGSQGRGAMLFFIGPDTRTGAEHPGPLYVSTTGNEAFDRAIAIYEPAKHVIVVRAYKWTMTDGGDYLWEYSEARAIEPDPPPPVAWQQHIAPSGFN